MKTLLRYRKTYTAGLLQAKAFRILKHATNEALNVYGINATDWGVLGLLIDTKDGIQLRAIAQEVGVKQPYITKSVTRLSALGYITVERSPHDARAQNAILTAKGKAFVLATEAIVLKSLKMAFKGVSTRSLLGYVQTLDAIVTNQKADYEHVDLDHLSE